MNNKFKIVLGALLIAGIATPTFAAPPPRHDKHHNEGLHLAAGIINLVGQVLQIGKPQTVVVTPPPPPQQTIVVTPPPPPPKTVVIHQPAPPRRHAVPARPAPHRGRPQGGPGQHRR